MDTGTVVTMLFIWTLFFAPLILWRKELARCKQRERARSEQEERVGGERARRVYLCFMHWGSFVLVVSAVLLITARASFTTQQVVQMGVAFAGGLPAVVVLLIGTFRALSLWREALIRLLLIATMTLVLCFIFADSLAVSDSWLDMITIGYGLLVVGVSLRGLRGLGRSAAS